MEVTSIWNAFRVIRRRFWVILLLLAVTMGVILYRAWTTPPSYRSSMMLQIIPLEPEEVTLYTRLDTVSSADTIDLIFYQFSALLRNPRLAQRALAGGATAGPLAGGMTAAGVLDGLSIERDPAGDLMTVSVAAPSPADAEKLVSRLVEVTLEEFRQSRALPSEASGKFLEAELVTAERELAAAREVLLKFQLDNGVAYLEREITAEQDSIRDLTTAAETAAMEAERLDAVVGALEKQAADAQAKAGAADANSPEGAYWLKLSQDLGTTVISRSADAAGKRAEADATNAQLARRKTNLASLITLTRESQRLEDAARERQATRDFLANKAREAQLKESQSRSIGYLQPVSAASARGQVAVRTVQVALLGAVLSVVAGIVIVFLMELLEQALRRSRAHSAAGMRAE